MENTKEFLQETRELLLKLSHNIDELVNKHNLSISLEVGSQAKTVNFNDVTTFEVTMKASQNIEL
jgi:hypothetical protein